MSTRSLGRLTLDLVAKVGGFEAGMDKASRTAKKTGKEISSAADEAGESWKRLRVVAAGALAGISAASIAHSFIENTKAFEQEQAQLGAVLKSTGEAAGFNRQQINDMANDLAAATTYSTNEINVAQTALLAFTGVVGNEFVRAQQAAADMSARTGMSMLQTAETIGRALDVPSQGMAALSRQGFRFTEEQKALMVELEATGRTAEAQGIILEALEESYGGAAKAARDTLGGALAALNNTIGGLLTGGENSLGALTSVVNSLNDALASPEAKIAVDLLAKSVVALSVVLAARLSGAAATTAVAFIAGQREAVRYQLALASMSGVSTVTAVRLTALGVAARSASAAMALIGGPVGLAVLAASAIVMFSNSASEAKAETEGLKEEVDYLNQSFEGFTKNQASAALISIQDELNNATLRALDAEDAIRKYEAQLRQHPDSTQVDQWSRSLIMARAEFDSAQQVVGELTVKVRELNAIVGSTDISSVAVSASKTFTEMSAKLDEQILLIGKRTDAEKLAARVSAGLIKGLKEGEGELLIEKQKTADAAALADAKLRESEQSARRAAQARSDAAKRAAREAENAAKRLQENIQRELTAIERAAAVWGMSADQIKLYDLAAQGATETQLKLAAATLDQVAALEAAKKLKEDYKRVTDDLRTEEERLTDEFRERIKVLDAMAESAGIGADEYERMAKRAADALITDAPKFAGLAPEVGGPTGELLKIDKAEKDLEKWHAKQLEKLEEFRKSRADLNATWDEQEQALNKQHQDRLLEIEQARQIAQSAAAEQSFGNMASAAKVFFGENSKLYLGAFALEKAYALNKARLNAPKAYSDAYAAVIGVPFVGPVLAPAAGLAAAADMMLQASKVGSISMTGMAHDGIDSIPQTGTWLLEKGERVTTAGTSAKLDATLEEIRRGQQHNRYDNRQSTVNQTFNVQGQVDRRTSAQLARTAAREQRRANQRLG